MVFCNVSVFMRAKPSCGGTGSEPRPAGRPPLSIPGIAGGSRSLFARRRRRLAAAVDQLLLDRAGLLDLVLQLLGALLRLHAVGDLRVHEAGELPQRAAAAGNRLEQLGGAYVVLHRAARDRVHQREPHAARVRALAVEALRRGRELALLLVRAETRHALMVTQKLGDLPRLLGLRGRRGNDRRGRRRRGRGRGRLRGGGGGFRDRGGRRCRRFHQRAGRSREDRERGGALHAAASAPGRRAATCGRVTRNRPPGPSSASIVPPWATANSRAIASPRPLPFTRAPVGRAPWKNQSNTLSR